MAKNEKWGDPYIDNSDWSTSYIPHEIIISLLGTLFENRDKSGMLNNSGILPVIL